MPSITPQQYESMRNGSKAMQDALAEMLAEGYTVGDQAPPAPKSSLLNFGKDLINKVRGDTTAQAAPQPPPQSRGGLLTTNARRADQELNDILLEQELQKRRR